MFPTVLSIEPFHLTAIERRAFCSRVLFLSAPEFEGCCCGSGLCWFRSWCCCSLVLLGSFLGRCFSAGVLVRRGFRGLCVILVLRWCVSMEWWW
ncbi:unnamed protein product [Trifolium pratense]|uniref:Uncharacterized protein n=1 Tax=Trifolium pratense TaxID=57577 RepID=A0ACB0LMY2_TRIPR|nr:unnamed protein product [Trifolium pratense]